MIKIILLILLEVGITASLLNLIKTISNPDTYYDQANKNRLITFSYIHIIYFFQILMLIKIKDFSSVIMVIFFSNLGCSILFENNDWHMFAKSVLPHQKSLNIMKDSYILGYYFISLLSIFLALMTCTPFLLNLYSTCLESISPGKNNQICDASQFEASKAEECPVCLSDISYSSGCSKIILCGHIFHTYCLYKWLVKQPTCPLCRLATTLPHEARIQFYRGGFDD